MHRNTTSSGRLLFIMLGFTAAVPGGAQQTVEPADQQQVAQEENGGPVAGRRGRFAIYSALTSFGYSSFGRSSSQSSQLGSLLADYYAVGSVSAGYRSSGQAGIVSFDYTPYYTRRIRFAELSSLDHTLHGSVLHRVNTRGRFRFSMVAEAVRLEQLAFFGSGLTNILGVSATADDLASAMLGRDQGNNQLATIFLQGDAGNPALLVTLFGSRVFNASTRIGYDWSRSPRSRIYFSADAGRSQPLDRSGLPGQSQYNFRSNSLRAVAGWSYDLTPRTTTGLNVEFHRSRSGYFNADVTQGNYTIGRQFRRRWIASGSAGGGVMKVLPRSDGTGAERTTPVWTAAGMIGVRGLAHGFLLNASRSAGDAYGAGSSATTAYNGAWNWTLPDRNWRLMAGFGYQHLQRGLFNDLRTWVMQGGVDRRLTHRTTLTFSLAYLDTPSRYGAANARNLSGIQTRMVFTWRNESER